VKESFSGIPDIQYEDLSPVTDAMYHALFSVMPKRRYRCGTDCEYYYYPVSLLPEWFNTWYWKMSLSPDGVTRSIIICLQKLVIKTTNTQKNDKKVLVLFFCDSKI
jgi:hypothetical protein